MVIERVEHPQFLSNAYLVADGPGGSGVLIDSNDVTGPLVERVSSDGITITHILLTHHHYDHVVGLQQLRERVGNPPVLAHELTRELIMDEIDEVIAEGSTVDSGDLRIEVLGTPGHCADHLAFVIDGSEVFTADVLFKGTVGGTRAPGATGFEDLRNSIMEKLMKLPPETIVHPGHREATSVGAEWEENPFIRIWRGLDSESDERCRVGGESGEEATLVLWAPDYDGGHKAWVRFPSGEDAIVGGSQVWRPEG
jgi:glyoxylase-like metal-dependent hydrolase (beta-lactamase superfamily II)